MRWLLPFATGIAVRRALRNITIINEGNIMWICDNWKDYELLDVSDGERLERWGKYILVRPDPQILWRGAAAYLAIAFKFLEA